MSFNWLDYLDLAKRLQTQAAISSEESEKRTAMSRAYYAAAMTSRTFLAKTWTVPRKETHAFIIGRFTKNKDRSYQKVGKDLKRLKDKREMADYDNAITDIDIECTSAIRLAEKIIDQVGKL